MRSRMWLLTVALVLTVALAGCGQKQAETPAPETPPPVPFRVTGVVLGKTIRPDMTVDAAMNTFGVRDTIYASVASEGATPGIQLKTRWVFQDGNEVTVSEKSIATEGPSVTELHASFGKPWPKGKYMIEIWADTTAVDTLEYEVK